MAITNDNRTISSVTRYLQSSPNVAQSVKGGSDGGGEDVLFVRDSTTANIMLEVLTELKKLNIYLAMITDQELTTSDVEGTEP